jgi:L-aspartate semialdehyde sulfurtransferase ferredoxin
VRRIVKLIFPRHLIKKPVIFTMAKEYNVMPNIRHAKIGEDIGEMVLELEGEEKNLDAGLQSLKDQGIGIEFVAGDVVE